MLPRLTVGFIVLTAAVAVAACSSNQANATVNVGPTFPALTLYAADSNQNAVNIYYKGQKSGTGPAYQIGGSSTTLNGPQYLAFDKAQNLWVTNFNPGTNVATLIEIEALATGNVLPLQSVTTVVGHLRGIGISPKASSTSLPELMVIASVIPTAKYPSELLLFDEGSTQQFQEIAGPNPQLNVPGGVAIDAAGKIYVTNLQSATVEQFTLPSPQPTTSGSPTPTPSPTPKPTPTPSSSPSGSPSPSPSPSPTATPMNLVPTYIITGALTKITLPTGISIGSNGDVYVSDQGNPAGGKPAAVLVFAPQTKGVVNKKPIRWIHGNLTRLRAPTDVKVDSLGNIYVADSTSSGAGMIYVFAPDANGNVKPVIQYTTPGVLTGLGVVP